MNNDRYSITQNHDITQSDLIVLSPIERFKQKSVSILKTVSKWVVEKLAKRHFLFGMVLGILACFLYLGFNALFLWDKREYMTQSDLRLERNIFIPKGTKMYLMRKVYNDYSHFHLFSLFIDVDNRLLGNFLEESTDYRGYKLNPEFKGDSLSIIDPNPRED